MFEEIAYDPDTGDLLCVKKYARNATIGKVLGSSSGPYLSFSYKGEKYRNHRVAWFLTYGYWPNMIDHIDGNPRNNRIDNLREVDHTGNGRNASKPVTNTSGRVGITWCKKWNKWVACIHDGSKRVHLGASEDFDEVVRLREEGEKFYGYHENHGR